MSKFRLFWSDILLKIVLSNKTVPLWNIRKLVEVNVYHTKISQIQINKRLNFSAVFLLFFKFYVLQYIFSKKLVLFHITVPLWNNRKIGRNHYFSHQNFPDSNIQKFKFSVQHFEWNIVLRFRVFRSNFLWKKIYLSLKTVPL